uniref:Uncharacterized protein n=1 Tax=Panagrolaimus davidi TaxID=227884 RepID=A0A914PTD6_9BILA
MLQHLLDEDDDSTKTSSTQASSTHQLPATLIIPDWGLAALDDNPQPPTDEFENEFVPPAPKSPPKSPLRQSTVQQSNETEELRQIQQKLLKQKEELRQKQAEIEAEEKALALQTSDSEDEVLQQYYEHLVNPPFVNDSLSPSPTLQQGFVPFGMNPYFNYPPQLAYMNHPQVSHEPINRQPAIVSAFPNNEMFDNTINKIRQYVSQKFLILVDKEASDSYLQLLKTRHFVVGGFATYFAAKESFVIFEHASNAGVLCIGLRVPQ